MASVPELQKFRQKYPDYNDVDDSQLAGMLAKKYPDAYGDLPSKVTSAPAPKQGLLQRAGKFIKDAASDMMAESDMAAEASKVPLKSVGRGVMRGYAKTADTALALVDALHEKDGRSSPARRLQETVTEPAIKHWTKQNPSKFEQVGEGIGEIGSFVTLGPAGIPAAAGNATYQTGKELLEGGASVSEAQKAGLIQGGAMAAMGAIPAAAKTVPKTVALATANPAIGMASRAATQKVLENKPELAKGYDPFDPVALTMDVATAGLAVPAHLRMKRAAAVTKPVTDPATAPKLEEAPETPRPTHDNLGEGVTAADSLELQNKAPHLKQVVKGTTEEVAALGEQGKLDGKVVHQEGDAAYVIDPKAVNPEEAIAAIKQGGDAESAALGYTKREGLTPEETVDVAVTKQGEVVTDLPQMKAETEAKNVAWAAEGKAEGAIPQAERVAEGIKGEEPQGTAGLDYQGILDAFQQQKGISKGKGKKFWSDSDFKDMLKEQYPSVADSPEYTKAHTLAALRNAAKGKRLTEIQQRVIDRFNYDHEANMDRYRPGDWEMADEREAIQAEGETGNADFNIDDFFEPPPARPMYDGEQGKMFATPPKFGSKTQGRGVAEENPMWTEMKERQAESQQTGLDFAQRQAASILDQTNPENGPAVGMSVQRAIPVDDSVIGLKSIDPKVERRLTAAHGLDAGPSMWDRIKGRVTQAKKEMQHFPELRKVEDAQTADILRQYESSTNAIKAKTYEYLRGLTTKFGPNKMKVFERKVLLDDLMGEVEKGRELPFGYDSETLAADHAAVSDLVVQNPDIQAAIERRTQVQGAVVDEAIAQGVLPETVKENPHYFRHMVLEYANAKRWAGLGNAEVRAKRRGWQNKRQGSEKDINTNFLEAEYEVMTQTMKEIATARTLKKVLDANAVKLKEGEAIPEGYVEWQPEKGNVFYRGQTLPEKMMEQFMEDNPYFNEIVDKFSEVTIKGGKKKSYIIPEGVAKTLDNLRPTKPDPLLGAINRKMVGAWKVWTLLSPRRAVKYNLNNMSGDLDAALAADPMILKHMKQAYQNGWNRMKGRAMSQTDIDMIDRGVLDSGISINEIPDINTLPGFRNLSPVKRQAKLWQALRSGDLKTLMPPNLIAKYFDKVSDLTNFREGLLREAAYMRALELLENGKEITWASKPKELAAIPDIKDRAAKLSRELIGDYGNISAHGEIVRERYIPFWSWMEINAPRYGRIFKNAAMEGKAGSTAARMAGIGTKKVVGGALGIAEKLVLTQMLFASISAFNHFMFPDEEASHDQKNLHLILGKTSDGKTLSVRFQGAFSDALSWFGLEDYPETFSKMRSGKMDTTDLLRKMALATPNKIANAALPYAKLGAELITKKSLYPDVTRPSAIRDRAEHTARFLSLDNEYRAATGKPSRGYGKSIKNMLTYESDPGETAYNYIRELGYKYMEKIGKEMPQGEPTKRSNALYYYKQALRYGDTEAVRKYKDRYYELGGSDKYIEASIKKSSPVAMTGKHTEDFMKTLTADDKEKLKLADRWYKKVYGVE